MERNTAVRAPGFSCCCLLICIEVPWSFSRSSIHCATGNRCSNDRALIIARTSCFDASAARMADLNCWIICFAVVDSTVNHHPGIWPSPPTLAPTPSAPLRPNSTATRPKGSSRDGIKANSAPLKIQAGRTVNSGLENTRPGYFVISFESLSAANLP